MKTFIKALYWITVAVPLILAEIFVLIPWAWAKFWPAAKHLWATPIAALALRDFGYFVFWPCVVFVSWGILMTVCLAPFEEEPSPEQKAADVSQVHRISV